MVNQTISAFEVPLGETEQHSGLVLFNQFILLTFDIALYISRQLGQQLFSIEQVDLLLITLSGLVGRQ